jgi:Ca2+-binding EF-hand superfamily protein
VQNESDPQNLNYDAKIWSEIVEEVDVNKDGRISVDEFREMMLNSEYS